VADALDVGQDTYHRVSRHPRPASAVHFSSGSLDCWSIDSRLFQHKRSVYLLAVAILKALVIVPIYPLLSRCFFTTDSLVSHR
jgi:hypothetical protein